MTRVSPAQGSSALAASCRRLLTLYDVDGWWPSRSRFEVMVGAVLVQNTRWPNVAAAINTLRVAGCLNAHAISKLEPADLAALIRPAGCQSVKARRLQALSAWVVEAGDLRRFKTWDESRLRLALLGIHGIGYETADVILCYALDRPRFIADKYARIWLGRIGVVPHAALVSYERCRAYVEYELRDAMIDSVALHAAIVMHGQASCSKVPACSTCALRADCMYARASHMS